jgi:squalene-hopene/tetraprenyl-beta-curcumene cyclase
MSHPISLQIEQAIDRLTMELAADKGSASHWTGELSTSALSTATAVSALSVVRSKQTNGDESIHELIENGSLWLARSQNSDGGFGDTNRSLSNIATTLLVLAAWQLADHNARYAKQIQSAWQYVEQQGSWDGLRQRYGKDKTFVVPIMTNCAIAGIVDWNQIPTLPFEAAALPQSWYRFAKMPVVSYAIPALVAIGQAQFYHRRPRNPLTRLIRSYCVQPTRRVLTQMQPTSGGYLEAIPLTSFVLMSLASIDQHECRVAIEAIQFIRNSVLQDGSWPIDTNLATWVTSLTSVSFYQRGDSNSERIHGHDRSPSDRSPSDSRRLEHVRTIDWLLSCQHVKRHPFTGADPGGWGWTNLSGAVPDADDTPAALLALHQWYMSYQRTGDPSEPSSDCHPSELCQMRMDRVLTGAAMGCRWLLKLQNSDGGWPTFCRGWGTLPFDRSGSDLTAHAIRALYAWKSVPEWMGQANHPIQEERIDRAIDRGWVYLAKQQRDDGSWLPLWFGNQDRPSEDNPVYGTGRVLRCFSDCNRTANESFTRGQAFLFSLQNPDGGWGGGPSIGYPSRSMEPGNVCSTIEETAIALDGIMGQIDTTSHSDSIMHALAWLSAAVLAGDHQTSQPIGFYFARLWYHERLYPLVFSLSALKKGLEICQR